MASEKDKRMVFEVRRTAARSQFKRDYKLTIVLIMLVVCAIHLIQEFVLLR